MLKVSIASFISLLLPALAHAGDLVEDTKNAAYQAARAVKYGLDNEIPDRKNQQNVKWRMDDIEKCLKGLEELKKKDANMKLELNGENPMTLDQIHDKFCKPAYDMVHPLIAAALDAATWPASATGKNTAKLKSAAVAWWKANYGKIAPAHRVENAEVVGVVITSDWLSGAKNYKGQTTRWDVRAHVALTNAELKKEGVAMVYDCSMVTKEELGVKQTTPFYTAVTGAPFKMKLSKVKK